MNNLPDSLPVLTEADLVFLDKPLDEEFFIQHVQINDEDLARLCEPLDDTSENEIILYSTDENMYDDLPILNISDLENEIELMGCKVSDELQPNFLNKPYDDYMDFSTDNDAQEEDTNANDMELDDYLINWPDVAKPEILADYFSNLYKEHIDHTNNSNMFGGSMFQVTKNVAKTLVKFNCLERTIELVTANPELDNFLTAGDMYFNLFAQIFEKYIEPALPKSKIRILVFHEDFQVPINLSFMDKQDLTVQMVFDAIDKTVQSKKKDPNFEIQANKKMTISLIITENPVGTGRSYNYNNKPVKYKRIDKQTIQNTAEYCQNLYSVYIVKNNDNLCLLRAYLIGKSSADKDPDIKKLKRPSSSVLKKRAQDLHKTMKFRNEACGIPEIKKLDEHFPGYQLMVISDSCETLYLNKEKQSSKYIYLLHRGNHFDCILSMKAFYKTSYWCDHCKKAYHKSKDHVCRYTCKSCYRIDCDYIQNIKCKNCEKYSRNIICSEIHKERICEKLKTCKKCNHIMKYKNHVCINEKWCKNCKESVDLEHKCFVKVKEIKETNEPDSFQGYIFFDFEAFENVQGDHEVNLAMAQKVCEKCLASCGDLCENCNIKHIFYNITDYCKWALRQKNTIQIAHNMKAYDGIFILNYIIKNMLPYEKKMPEVISNGTKILSLEFRTIKIIDSLSFLPMALEKFPKTFDLKELKKGFFLTSSTNQRI